MRIALALTSALSMAALAQPAPATAPAPTPPPSAAAPAPKPAEATEAKPPAPATATAQPAATPASKPEAPPATAQPATPPAPKPEEPPAAAQPATPPAVPATATARTPATVVPARGSGGLTLPAGPPPQDQVRERAKIFFHALQQSNARELVELSAFPFYVESQRFDQADLLLQEWTRHLRAKRTDLLTLYGIDVYTPAEMEQKYGKPPARLKDIPLRGPVFIAVANVSGHATVLVFRDVDQAWRVIAYSD